MWKMAMMEVAFSAFPASFLFSIQDIFCATEELINQWKLLQKIHLYKRLQKSG